MILLADQRHGSLQKGSVPIGALEEDITMGLEIQDRHQAWLAPRMGPLSGDPSRESKPRPALRDGQRATRGPSPPSKGSIFIFAIRKKATVTIVS